MGHHGAFSKDQTLVSFLHKELQSRNAQAMIKPNPNSQRMNKSYQISPSFISSAVKNNEGVEGGLKERMELNNFLPLKSREVIRKRGLSRGLTLFQCKIIFRQRKVLDLAEQNVDLKFI